MAIAPTQIRVDADIKKVATALFLHQCVLHRGLPFAIEMPRYSQQTLDAMIEAKRISRDPDVKGYDSMEELKAALDE